MRLSCERTREDMVGSVFMNGAMVFGVLDEFAGGQESCIQILWHSKQTRGGLPGKKGGDPFEKYLG